MSSSWVIPSQFKKIVLERQPIVDVRAPIEFDDGCIPGSVNLPIMNNEERAQVGTTFKKQGRDAAIALGQSLVSGELREQRIQAWNEFIALNPNAIITCFRGGLRSKIAQEWLAVPRPRIEGGYKAFRNFLLQEVIRIANFAPLLVVSGATGCGKTQLLQAISSHREVLDLEKIANHRGSAFGAFSSPQPGQTNFENILISELIHHEEKLRPQVPLLLEDESLLIGSRAIPKVFFQSMRASPIVLIEESMNVRVENTFIEYVVKSEEQKTLVFQKFIAAVARISKKLGGARAQELIKDITECEQTFAKTGALDGNRLWIEKIFRWYYDPMYLGSIEQRAPKILFRGIRQEVLEYLKG